MFVNVNTFLLNRYPSLLAPILLPSCSLSIIFVPLRTLESLQQTAGHIDPGWRWPLTP